ncbi:hypothetical protein BpHYR1_029032 [Brachionus plicatilis]|uniref:Uncharacterized protein n=1 Tax=Brachionus plicatilis TaxID=10195 RepID=A0A3M7SW57_BRAPC|nr:hypothetical protein BpHYR1_029032 [Brachionus plicatilis]
MYSLNPASANTLQLCAFFGRNENIRSKIKNNYIENTIKSSFQYKIIHNHPEIEIKSELYYWTSKRKNMDKGYQ